MSITVDNKPVWANGWRRENTHYYRPHRSRDDATVDATAGGTDVSGASVDDRGAAATVAPAVPMVSAAPALPSLVATTGTGRNDISAIQARAAA